MFSQSSYQFGFSDQAHINTIYLKGILEYDRKKTMYIRDIPNLKPNTIPTFSDNTAIQTIGLGHEERS